ncbi:hypothetical protein OEZ85_014225 [Tetradesmus obliquus]|uniref:Major facilitator superfamily (MFS) profile domain-containing protein n=1 Tax=Tetradesmus obliquus TaxID=3088 RepID=A0ABY8U9N3_TETOB|nr:hypothetical protein OEZ85_014225 [Tetradesmus obliquus]
MVARGQLVLLCSTTFLYALCFMAQAPLLPYMIDKLGAKESNTYGLLMSTFSGLQLVGSLLSGPLVDAYGGKLLLIISFASSAACYTMTATASSIWMLFVSRLATLMQHAVLAARTIVTAQSPADERAALLGYIGASYGCGFALGPAAGGLLSSISLQATAWAAAAGSVLALGIVALLLPADSPSKQQQRKEHSTSSSGSSNGAAVPAPQQQRVFSIASLAAVVQHPGVPSLLLVQACSGLAQSVFQSTFSLLIKKQYGLSSKANGMMLSYVGCCIVFAQAVVIKPVSKRVGETAAVRGGCGLLVLSFLALGSCRELWQLLACLLPLAVAGVTVATLNVARLTKAVPTSQAGTVMALDMSLGSGLRTVAPLLGTWMMQRYGYPAVAGSCAALVLAALLQQLAIGRQEVDASSGQQEKKEQ